MRDRIRRRGWTAVVAIAVAWCCACAARADAFRDWQKHPPVVQIEMPHVLYALGDTHGDSERLMQLLAGTRLIADAAAKPEAIHWTAGDAVLVCTGDMIDKYEHSMGVIAIMRALQAQAEKSGGRVIVTLGNHEAEFLGRAGHTSDFADELSAAGISPADVIAGRDAQGIGHWLRDLPAAARVGDWFFCHAGDTSGMSIAQLDHDIQQQLDASGFNAPILLNPNSLLEARMHPRPWWDWNGSAPQLTPIGDADKAASKPRTDPGEARLRGMIQALGVKHLVFGHQPQEVKFLDGTTRPAGAMWSKFNGLVFMIDTGMSRGVNGGAGAVLEIHQTARHLNVDAVYADGKMKTMLDQAE